MKRVLKLCMMVTLVFTAVTQLEAMFPRKLGGSGRGFIRNAPTTWSPDGLKTPDGQGALLPTPPLRKAALGGRVVGAAVGEMGDMDEVKKQLFEEDEDDYGDFQQDPGHGDEDELPVEGVELIHRGAAPTDDGYDGVRAVAASTNANFGARSQEDMMRAAAQALAMVDHMKKKDEEGAAATDRMAEDDTAGSEEGGAEAEEEDAGDKDKQKEGIEIRLLNVEEKLLPTQLYHQAEEILRSVAFSGIPAEMSKSSHMLAGRSTHEECDPLCMYLCVKQYATQGKGAGIFERDALFAMKLIFASLILAAEDAFAYRASDLDVDARALSASFDALRKTYKYWIETRFKGICNFDTALLEAISMVTDVHCRFGQMAMSLADQERSKSLSDQGMERSIKVASWFAPAWMSGITYTSDWRLMQWFTRDILFGDISSNTMRRLCSYDGIMLATRARNHAFSVIKKNCAAGYTKLLDGTLETLIPEITTLDRVPTYWSIDPKDHEIIPTRVV